MEEIISDPRGTSGTYYSWGLGIASNNRAEAYTLWHGLKVGNELGIQFLIIIGDSKTVISHMVNNSKPFDHSLASILDRSRHMKSLFSSCIFILSCFV